MWQGFKMTAVSEAYGHLASTPGVRSGNVCIKGTRIGVHDVIGLLQNGETIDSLINTCFPGLAKSQIYQCLAYYEDHKGEIDLLVARQMAEAGQ